MKIRLIQPSQLDEDGHRIRYRKLFFPNSTMPTIAALTPDDVDVGITVEYVEEVDFDEDVDLVGITAQTCQAPRAYQIADEFRKRGRRTLMGGLHASIFPDEALQHFDSAMVGEAEGQWEEVIEDVKAGTLKPLYNSGDKPDLSRLVIPRYDLLDYEQYVIPPLSRTPLIPIQTVRGCPNRCEFCSVSRFWGHHLRKKPLANVVKEIETIRPSRIFFSDDNITADPKHARALFAAVKPLKTRWACQMSTTIMQHPELIAEAAAAGCHENYMGIESLNPHQLAAMHKSFNKVDQYKEMFTRLKDVGILAQASVIFGLDGDKADDLRRMIDMLLGWDINYIYIAILTPFPGTELFERLAAEGRILTRDWSLYDGMHVVYQPTMMTPGELEDVAWEMYDTCYSAANILERAWRFLNPYVRFFPRDNMLEEVFFQFQIRSASKRRIHPFSLGPRK